MRILSDLAEVGTIEDRPLRELVAQRFEDVSQGESFDPENMARFVVVEPGDTVAEIESASGACLTRTPFGDLTYGEPGFRPCFDFLECHDLDGRLYEYVEILNDGGFGVVLFIRDLPGMDERLLRFCREYAEPAPKAA